MAGKTITQEDLTAAVAAYCRDNGKQHSTDENGRIRIFKDTPDPETDRLLWLEGGSLRGNDIDFTLSFAEEYLRPSVVPVSKAIVPTSQKKPGNAVPAKRSVSDELTEEDILNYLCPNATPKEAYIAVQVCKDRKLDPWDGSVHFIKYGNAPLTIVAGKEHFTKKAEANPQFDGFQAGIVVKTDAGYEELEGTFYMDGELVGGWAKVWRKDRKEPFVQKVRLSAFNTGKALWQKMPEVMVRKCALVQALREAFPGDLGGVYDSSEMGQAIDVEFEEA